MSAASVLNIPPIVRNKAIAAGAEAWLDALPFVIGELEREWGFVIGEVFTGGTEALVAEATLSDGTGAVLKVMVERAGDHARNEIAVLRFADGRGCCRLLRCDESRGAMLIERLGRSLSELDLSLRQRHEILVDTSSRLWRPAPDLGLPTGAEKGRWFIDYIGALWAELDRPCSAAAVEHARTCAQRRVAAHDDGRAVLVHGDVHQWNVLEADDGFKLVDPDGLLAEAEYDLGIIMREDPVELIANGDPQARAHWLADRTGLDAVAIWEWGVVERVSTGLLCTKIDLQPVGAEMLAAADVIARSFSVFA